MSNHKSVENLAGLKFGRLLVDSEAARNPCGRTRWNCTCACGKRVIVRSCHLKSGHTVSCGCWKIEVEKQIHLTHGKSYSFEYGVWAGMIKRCTKPKEKNYKWYGGRGITVCDRWRSSFMAFYQDMGAAPSRRHSIDRKNVDGNYEPTNCRWATQTEQSRNSRNRCTNKTGVRGVYFHKGHKTYVATIRAGGRQVTLGESQSLDEAAVMRKQGEALHWCPQKDRETA